MITILMAMSIIMTIKTDLWRLAIRSLIDTVAQKGSGVFLRPHRRWRGHEEGEGEQVARPDFGQIPLAIGA